MSGRISTELARDLLGSASMFLSAMGRVFESQPLAEATGGQLTAGQLRLLEVAALTNRLKIGEVASFLRVTPAAASQSVDRLVRRRLLKRSGGTRDRRTSQIALTTEGRRVLAAVQAAQSRQIQAVFGRFSPDELRKTAELLDRLSREVNTSVAGADGICVECGTHFRERCVLRGLNRCACFYDYYGSRPRDAAKPRRGQSVRKVSAAM